MKNIIRENGVKSWTARYYDAKGNRRAKSFSDKKFGGVVAAPVFKKIATDSLRILNISPDNIDAYEKKYCCFSLNSLPSSVESLG